jgi:hypothetical protein
MSRTSDRLRTSEIRRVMTMSRTSITSGQKEQYEHVVTSAARHGASLALEKVEADDVGWQRVVEHGDELRTAIAEVVVAKTHELSVSNQYADEEGTSNYGYLSGYQPKPIAEQVKVLRELFPELGSVDESLAEADLLGGTPNPDTFSSMNRLIYSHS